MKNLILCCTLLFALNSFGQNLITNPSFENITLPEFEIFPWGWYAESIEYANEWFPGYITPDLINHDSTAFWMYFARYSTLTLDSLYQLYEEDAEFFFPARTGTNYVTSVIYCDYADHIKEILGYELENELIAGEEYCMRFHVKLGTGFVTGIDQIGAFFYDEYRSSNNILSWETWQTFEPQISSPIGEPIIDTVEWTTISGSFIADGTEKYIYFGVFENNEDLTLDTIGGLGYDIDIGPVSKAVYHFDDFSLYKCGEESFPADAGKDECITIGDSIQLGSHDYEDYFYEWRVNDSVFSTEGMPWVSPDTTSIYGLYQQDFAFTESWSQVSVVVVENPEDECVGLGVNEQLDSEIRVYPNPSNSLVHVNTKIAIEIWALKDALGREVKSSKSILESPFTIDISALEIGVYYLELYSREYKSVKQLIVTY